MVAFMMVLYYLFVILKYALILLGVLLVVWLIYKVVDLIYKASCDKSDNVIEMPFASKPGKTEYAENSVGALLSQTDTYIANNNIAGIINKSGELKNARDVVAWFKDVVENHKYTVVKDTDEATNEEFYAIIMENHSGYNFKSFACKAIPSGGGMTYDPVMCKAEDWPDGAEGFLYFDCPSTDVNMLTIEANDLQYVIDSETKESNKEYKMASVEFPSGGARYDYIIDGLDVSVGDKVVVDANGSEKTVKIRGINMFREDELALPRDKYKFVLRKADADDESDVDDVDDADDLDDMDFDKKQEEEQMAEAFICPECFEPYDGIYCENCGHSNDEVGYEEVSDDDKWFEDMMAVAMLDAEDKRRESGNDLDWDEEDEF